VFRSPDHRITRSPNHLIAPIYILIFMSQGYLPQENLRHRSGPGLPTSARMVLMVPVTTGEQALPTISAEGTPSAKLAWAALAYVSLLVILWWIARYFHLKQLEDHPISTLVSFALLFAPYWFFGFGAAERVRRILRRPAERIAAAALLTAPYVALAIPGGSFRWALAGALVGLAVISPAVLEVWRKPANWADLAVLSTVGLVIDLGLLSTSGPLVVPGPTLWPPGLGGFPKLMMMNVALYCYLVVKPIEGIGYDLVPRASDFKTGLREFVFYAPFAILLGFFLGFLHFHRSWPQPFMVPAAWIFTFIFVAMPEELF